MSERPGSDEEGLLLLQPEPASTDASMEGASMEGEEQRLGEPRAGAEEGEAREDPAAEPEPGAGERLDDEELARSVAALLFASPEPLGLRRIAELLEGPRSARVRSALEEVARRLDAAGLPIELREIAGGWQFLTSPEVHATVAKLAKTRKSERLSAAGLETLAVIAYRQPVTKAEIEAIRGVQCGPMLRTLIDRGLVRVTGRAEVPGHPLQYGTTRTFLDRFGLASLSDLPRDGELLGE